MAPLGDDLLAGKVEIMQRLVQALQAAGTADGVDATLLAAAAGISGNGDGRIAGCGCDDRPVTPFAGKAASFVDEAPVGNQAATDAGAEDGAEDDAVAAAGAETGFGHRETVGIVGDQHRQAELGFEVGAKRAVVDAGNVGADQALRIGIDDAGDGKGDAVRLFAGFGDDAAQGLDESGKIIPGRRAAAEGKDVCLGVGDAALDSGAADVE